MPLSSPRGESVGNFTSLANSTLRAITNPLGPDAAINFFGILRNPRTGTIVIGGNTSFTGTFSSIQPGFVTEHATLFSTVIAAGDAQRMAIDDDNEGLIVQSGNTAAFARTDDGGASWTALGAVRVLTYKGIEWWNGQIVALADNAINLDISSDGGVTFPITADSQQPGAAVHNFLYTNDEKTHLVVAGDDGISWTTNEFLTVAGNWTAVDMQAFGLTSGVASMAINPAGTHCVVCAASGVIIVASDSLRTFALWPNALNPFRNNNGPSADPSFVVYIASLSSFLIIGSTGGPTTLFLISEAEIEALAGGSFGAWLGRAPAATSTQRAFGNNIVIDGDRFIAAMPSNRIITNW